MGKKFDMLALGEVLLRLSPEGNERLTQGTRFEKQLGGAELNVAVGAANLGLTTGIISKIPSHAIGNYAKREIRRNGVDTDYLAGDDSADSRLGIYYYEYGADPRKPQVVYDRKYSSVNKLSLEDFPEEMYENTRCFHTSGITLGLGGPVRENAIEMMKKFKEKGALISFDVNFRGNLWTGDEARDCITKILPIVDIFFCSESTANLTFGKTGDIKEILKSFSDEYDIAVVAATQRIVHSPKSHTFGSVIYEKKTDSYYEEKPYEKIEVVDRIGSGDAYISGALYGLLTSENDTRKALQYGNAVSALKNTVPGDLPSMTLCEVEEMIKTHQEGDNGLEMKR